LRSLFQKLVDQDGTIRSESDCVVNVRLERFLIVDDRHRASAENVTRTDQHRITDSLRYLTRFLDGSSHAVVRLRNAEFIQQSPEAFAIFSEVYRIRRRSDDFDTGFMQAHREVQRCLPAKLDDDAVRLFDIDDVHHVFEREWLKIESIRSVVIGRDGFGIAVDHDGLEPRFVKRERSVTTAVIKFDSLPDAIRTGAKDHD